MSLVVIPWLLLICLTSSLDAEYVGNLRGDLSMHQGQAAYNLPIILPKGPNNIQPDFHIVYNSGGGNGALGDGWEVDVVSSITRCPQTFAQDGRSRGVAYNRDDRFCLDGQRLVAISGADGEDGSEYRTEVDTYNKVVACGQHGSGPSSFKVWAQDGRILDYGLSRQSQIIGSNQNSVHQWNLERVTDRSGNTMNMTYIRNSKMLSALTYGTTTVSFHYETRPDASKVYFKGTIMSTIEKRMTTIEVNNPYIVRRYLFTYDASGSGGSQQSLLESVKLCDPNGNCLNPLKFEYGSSGKLVETFAPYTQMINTFGKDNGWTVRDHPRFVNDVNGDGLPDIVGFASSCVFVALNNGRGQFDTGRCWVNSFGTSAGGWTGDKHPRELGDINGDGLPDVVGFANDGVYVAFNTGSSFRWPIKLVSSFGYDQGWRTEKHPRYVMDMNGDGRADIVGFANDGVYVALSKGEHFEFHKKWSNTFGFVAGGFDPSKYLRVLRDVNGDGLPDIVGFGNSAVAVAINSGTSFLQHSTWSGQFHYNLGWRVENHPRFVEDINGDGLADIIGFANDGVYVSLSTGTSFTDAKLVVRQFGYSHGGWRVNMHPRYVVDVTGDGLPDIVGFANDGVYVSYNIGDGQFSTPKNWLNSFGHSAGGWRVESHPRYVIDANGDGISDIVGFGNAGAYVSLNRNSQPQIHEVVDSFGVRQSLKYQSMPQALRSGHYEKTGSSQYPLQYSVPSMNVLTEINWNKATDASNSTKYYYSNLRFDVSGRGSQGFHWSKKVDSANRYVQTEQYQDFPLTGKISAMINSVPSSDRANNIILDTRMYYNTSHSSVYDVVNSREDIKSYELDGSLIRQIETRNFGTDGYGNVLESIQTTVGGHEVFTSVTSNTYSNDVGRWLIGQLISSSTTHSCPTGNPVTKQVTYAYELLTGYLKTQIIQPGHSNALQTSYEYDHFGNVISSSEAPSTDSSQARVVITSYDEKGIHKTSSRNGKGHTETYAHDSHGNLVSLTGANGLETTWTYDLLGRKIQEHRSDGTQIVWSYNWDTTLPGAKYNVQMTSEGSPPKTRVFDALSRVIREQSVGFNGSDIYEDITYNTMGHVSQHSLPYFASAPREYVIEEYDILDRMVRKSSPGSGGTRSEKRTSYYGLQSTETDALGHETHMEDDVFGRLVNVTDHLGGTVQYQYDCVGNIVKTTDTAGHMTTIEYDVLGNKISFDDPNMGQWHYEHNAFGEVIRQQDANQNILTHEYDVLGRLVKRIEPEGTTIWTYDDQPNGLGKLSSVQGPDGYKKTLNYDNYGREYKTDTLIQDKSYVIQTSFDGYGRIIQEEYPKGELVNKNYTGHGFLKSLSVDYAGNSLKEVWRALDYDAAGHLIKEHFGNSLVTDYKYDSSTHLVDIKTHDDGNRMRHLGYTYDVNDNVLSRNDFAQGVSETFSYDGLDRLHQSTVANAKGNYAKRQNWDYYQNGNIRFNDATGLGQFTYHSSKPQAVVKVGNINYAYDNNGNMIMRNGKAISWSSYNKPVRFETDNGHIRIKYGPLRQRYMKTSSNGDSSIYLGKSYEIQTKNNTSTAQTFVYGAMGRIVAIVALKDISSDPSTTLSYVHTDNMGSIDTLTDEYGQIVDRYSYDAFGLRRAGDWKNANQQKKPTGRGYTEHEHLDELGLIHMNGRVYDPLIGRFLSPDPHVQDSTNTQALNRYTYALNNPLKHNDPSGFFFKKLKKLVKKYWRPIVAAAVAYVTFGAATPLAATLVGSVGLTGTVGAVATGAVAGAVSGFAGGVVASGNIKGGLQGAAGGALMGGISGYFGGTWNVERVTAQATAGGVTSEIGGGKFKDGFIKAGLAAGARYLYNKVVQYDVDSSPGGPAKYKTEFQRPYPGRNNVGIQGNVPDPAWVDKDQFLNINWNEGGGLSRLLNKVPRINAVAGMHDVFQVKLDTVLFPGARDWFNVPGMPVAAVVTHYAFQDGPGMPALLVDETRKRKR